MSELSREIRKHFTGLPKHLQKRPNGQRLLAATEEIEALEAKNKDLEAKVRELSAEHGHRHAHHDSTRVKGDESEKR